MTDLSNWKTQIRKGYLELCILLLIDREQRIYGFDLLEKLKEAELELKEGTLYPLLSRMTSDGILSAVWETEGGKGHPRKFYSLTREGRKTLEAMSEEFQLMVIAFNRLRKK